MNQKNGKNKKGSDPRYVNTLPYWGTDPKIKISWTLTDVCFGSRFINLYGLLLGSTI